MITKKIEDLIVIQNKDISFGNVVTYYIQSSKI
jgi:hypothetical protein